MNLPTDPTNSEAPKSSAEQAALALPCWLLEGFCHHCHGEGWQASPTLMQYLSNLLSPTAPSGRDSEAEDNLQLQDMPEPEGKGKKEQLPKAACAEVAVDTEQLPPLPVLWVMEGVESGG